MPHKIGVYIRVSTEEQAQRTEGSLENQKHRLNGFIDIKNHQTPDWGLVVDSYLDDGYSAENTNRPEFQRLLRDLKRGRISMVLVADLSRLSRNIRDFCGLLDLFKELKVKFLSIKDQFDTTTAVGEMMLFNMINLAQFERRQISERVTLNFHSRALRGLRNGGAATLGFKVNPSNKSTFEINLDEVGFVKQIFETFLEQGSLYRAAQELRRLKIPTKPASSDGSRTYDWNTQTLGNLLRNQTYIGMREVNKSQKGQDQSDLKPHEQYNVVKAAWLPIVDEGTFYSVQSMLDRNQKSARERRSNMKERTFVLTGLLSCAQCGRPLVGSSPRGRNKEFRYYVHRAIEGKPATCEIKNFPADKLEEKVVNHLLNVVNRQGYLDGIEKNIDGIRGNTLKGLAERRRTLEKNVAQADRGIKRLIQLQIKQSHSDVSDLYIDQLKELKRQRGEDSNLLREISATLDEKLEASELRKVIQTNLSTLQRAWAKATPPWKKALIGSVIHKVVLKTDGLEIYYHEESSAESRCEKAESKMGKPANDFGGLVAQRAKFRGSYIGKIGCGGRI